MGEQTKIEWCDMTFNPWIGCTKLSPGCQNCYALDLMETRYRKVKWGPQGTRLRTSETYWKQPYKWNKQAKKQGTRFRVFCASLADMFEDREELIDWRRDLLILMENTPYLDWLLLTKRPENVMSMIEQASGTHNAHTWFEGMGRRVWMGTSVEDQKNADERIPELLKIPARIRFLSAEPLLGPIYLAHAWLYDYVTGRRDHAFIDWVIVGGESGPKARPMHPDWARSLRDQCKGNIPFHFKQHGEWISKLDIGHLTKEDGWKILPEWKEAVKGRESGCLSKSGEYLKDTTTWNGRQGNPEDDYEVSVYKVGKHAAGRLLDGQIWDEFP